MSEPKELAAARAQLAQAEARFLEDAGLPHLQDGLALLETVLEGPAEYRSVARNLGSAYASKIYGRAAALIASDAGVPETQCELLFKVLLAFDGLNIELPAQARDTKIAVVLRLIDRYYEGHSEADKARAVQQLMELSD